MVIVSLSISDELLKDIDLLRKEFGFKGRSDLVRVALTELKSDLNKKRVYSKNIDAVIVAVHKEDSTFVPKLIHRYGGVIKTQMHNHTTNKKCMDIFVLNGDSKEIKAMSEGLLLLKNVESSKLIIP